MKVLTICQPYADMIANGEKWIENRTWSTNYRGPLAIHAGKSRQWLEPDDERERPGMDFGAVIATCELVDCCRLEGLDAVSRDHIHAQGPWCWVLADVVCLDVPIPAKGSQGLWDWLP